MRQREEKAMGSLWERGLICVLVASILLGAGLADGFDRGREMEVRIATTGPEDIRTFVRMQLTLIDRGEGYVRARVTEPELARLTGYQLS